MELDHHPRGQNVNRKVSLNAVITANDTILEGAAHVDSQRGDAGHSH